LPDAVEAAAEAGIIIDRMAEAERVDVEGLAGSMEAAAAEESVDQAGLLVGSEENCGDHCA
jgi:hypothetical protein